MSIALFVGTRKGAFVLRSNDRSKWELVGPSYLGHTANHVVLDPRDGRTVLMASHAGHLGPTVYRSTDAGLTWTEAEAPPRFPKVPEGEEAPEGAAEQPAEGGAESPSGEGDSGSSQS